MRSSYLDGGDRHARFALSRERLVQREQSSMPRLAPSSESRGPCMRARAHEACLIACVHVRESTQLGLCTVARAFSQHTCVLEPHVPHRRWPMYRNAYACALPLGAAHGVLPKREGAAHVRPRASPLAVLEEIRGRGRYTVLSLLHARGSLPRSRASRRGWLGRSQGLAGVALLARAAHLSLRR